MVVRDEKTGAVMVLTQSALDYLKAQGQGLDDSDFAKIIKTFDLASEKKYQEEREKGPKELQVLAEKVYSLGGFTPLPEEWMTLVATIGEMGEPEIIAVLPSVGFVKQYRFNHDVWLELYPSPDGRVFADPVTKNRKAFLTVKLGLDENNKPQRQAMRTPFTPDGRSMQGQVDVVNKQVVISDEYGTATHEWDDQKGEWVELDEYRVFGAPKERMAHVLDYKLHEVRLVDGVKHTNVLSLDPAEVEWAIEQLNNDVPIEEINGRLKSFQFIPDAEGEPQMVAVVGGEYGLTPAQLENLEKAAAGLEAVDPGILAFLSNQFGAKFISSGTSFTFEDKGGNFSSNDGVDTIIAKRKSVKTIADFIFVLLAESGEINGGRHMVHNENGWVLMGNLSEYKNFGVFAMQWTIDWLKLHGEELVKKGVITQKELNDITNLAKYNLEQYQNAP